MINWSDFWVGLKTLVHCKWHIGSLGILLTMHDLGQGGPKRNTGENKPVTDLSVGDVMGSFNMTGGDIGAELGSYTFNSQGGSNFCFISGLPVGASGLF